MEKADDNYSSSATDSFPSTSKTNLGVLHQIESLNDGSFSEQDLETIAYHLDDYTVDDAYDIVRNAIIEHENDPCLPESTWTRINHLVDDSDSKATDKSLWEINLKFEAFLIHQWSIYPEVRSVTKPIDESDPEGYENLRVYVIAILWSCAGSCLATFFAVRYPAISLGSVALQILIAYTGHLWALVMPSIVNRGPWTFKEQMLATLMMSASSSSPYSQDAIITQSNDYFYGFSQAKSFGYVIMLTLSSQFMGFGIAGILRNFLVYPVRCVWYGVLPSIAISRTLTTKDSRENINGWRMRRYEFFWLFVLLFFGWYWVTTFLFSALGYFDWIAWIAPNNVKLQAITGCMSGLALNPISSFDPSIFGVGSMITPWEATLVSFIGTIISFFAIVIIWFTNVRWTGYLPINTNGIFANDGSRYQIRKVLNSRNLLDIEKYQQYSLPFWSAGNIVVYGSFFMLYPAMMVYAALNYGKIIVSSVSLFFKSLMTPSEKALERHNDRFSRTQQRYAEVPELWFLGVLLSSIGLAIATVEYYNFTTTPVWTIFFGVGLSLIFMIPTGYLFATTNVTIFISVLFELIIGYALPGNGNALMVSKVYGANFMSQTDNYITNQVQGHYCGIAPRSLFRGQMIATLANTFVQAGLMYWQSYGGIPDMCNPKNKDRMTCLSQQTYFSAAVQWGTIGPKRVFKGLYPTMKYCFLIGAIYPIPFWLARTLAKRYRRWNLLKKLLSFNEMVCLVGAISWAPQNFMYTIPPVIIGFCFNHVIKSKYPRWWAKYNYILYAAINVAIGYAALIEFFATEYTHPVEIDWWGNNVYTNTLDGQQSAARVAVSPARGYFGPEKGSFP